jgi:hypothetical protein
MNKDDSPHISTCINCCVCTSLCCLGTNGGRIAQDLWTSALARPVFVFKEFFCLYQSGNHPLEDVEETAIIHWKM